MTQETPKHQLDFRILRDNGRRFRLAVYVDGEYAGTCLGYRTARGYDRDRIEIYPECILPTYARMKGLDLRTYRYMHELRWA